MLRVDATSNGYLVHRYLAKCEFVKMDDNDPENKKVAYHKKYYKIQWKNIENDLKRALERVGNPVGIRHPLPAYAQFGALAVDSADSGAFQNSGVSTTLTVNHTCATGSVLVGVNMSAYAAPTNYTYNSVSMGTHIITTSDDVVNIYGLLNPGTGSSYPLTATLAGTSPYALAGISFTGAETSFGGASSATTDGSSASPYTLSLTTTRDNSIIVSGGYAAPQTSALTSDQTDFAGAASEGYWCVMSRASVANSGTNKTFTWSHSDGLSRYHSMAMLEIRGAIAATPTGHKFLTTLGVS